MHFTFPIDVGHYFPARFYSLFIIMTTFASAILIKEQSRRASLLYLFKHLPRLFRAGKEQKKYSNVNF